MNDTAITNPTPGEIARFRESVIVLAEALDASTGWKAQDVGFYIGAILEQDLKPWEWGVIRDMYGTTELDAA